MEAELKNKTRVSVPSSPLKEVKATTCPTCHKNFANSGIYRHMRLVHKQPNYKEVLKGSPPSLRFDKIEHFQDWKRKIEGEDGAFFIITSSKMLQYGKRSYYICNRSGSIRREVPDDKRKRRFKVQGSRKINGTCTARFTARFDQQGVLVTDLHRTHSGHELELVHLPIPSSDKERIASMIAAQVPFDYILDTAQCESSIGGVSRVQLINKQDLRNIAAQYSRTSFSLKETSDDAVAQYSKTTFSLNETPCGLKETPGDTAAQYSETSFLLNETPGELKATPGDTAAQYSKTSFSLNETPGDTAAQYAKTSFSLNESPGELKATPGDTAAQYSKTSFSLNETPCELKETPSDTASQYSNTSFSLKETPGSIDEVEDDLGIQNFVQEIEIVLDNEAPSPSVSIEDKKNEVCALFQSIIQKCSTERQICLTKNCLEQLNANLVAEEKKRFNFLL